MGDIARAYSGAPLKSTIAAGITGTPVSVTIFDVSGWPIGAPFTITVDPGLSTEEKILGTRSGNTFTITTRGYDGTTSQNHAANCEVYPVALTAVEATATNLLTSTLTTQGDLIIADASGNPVRLARGTAGQVLEAGASTLAWGQVDTAGIADGAVTTAKILDANVTTAKIGDLQVTAAKIANDTITATQIAANAIGASELADNAVDTAAIAANAVTPAKATGFGAFDTDEQDRDNNTTSYVFTTGQAINFTFTGGRIYKITETWTTSGGSTQIGTVCIRVGGAIVAEGVAAGFVAGGAWSITYVSSSLAGTVLVDVGVKCNSAGTYGIEGTDILRRPFLIIEDIT